MSSFSSFHRVWSEAGPGTKRKCHHPCPLGQGYVVRTPCEKSSRPATMWADGRAVFFRDCARRERVARWRAQSPTNRGGQFFDRMNKLYRMPPGQGRLRANPVNPIHPVSKDCPVWRPERAAVPETTPAANWRQTCWSFRSNSQTQSRESRDGLQFKTASRCSRRPF